MLDVKALLAKVIGALESGYVVEQGTSNGWNYIKWNNGRFEADKVYTLTVAANGWTSGSGAYYSAILDLGAIPFAFDTNTAVLVGSAGQQCKLINPSINGNTGYVGARFERGAAAAVSATAHIRLTGFYTT